MTAELISILYVQGQLVMLYEHCQLHRLDSQMLVIKILRYEK